MNYYLLVGVITALFFNFSMAATQMAAAADEPDGQWRTYSTHAPLTALAVHGDKLWVGATQGLIRFNRTGGSSVTYTSADGLANNSISALAVDHAGQPWAGDWSGSISRLDGEQWKILFGTELGLTEFIPPIAALQPSAGRIWFGTPAGVSLFDGTAWRSYTTADGLVDNDVRAVAIDPQGRLWFGTAAGVSRLDGNEWTSFRPLTNSLVSNFVQTVAVGPASEVWFGYGERGQGVTVYDGQTWRTYTRADGLVDDHVFAIALAPDGAAWLGTAAGASRLRLNEAERADGPGWTTFTHADGLLTDTVRAIAAAPDGSVWFGTAAGVSRLAAGQWHSYTAADGLAAGPVNSIAAGQDGRVWVGTEPVSPGDRSGGVSVFDGQAWITFPATHDNRGAAGVSDRLVGDWVTAVAVDGDNRPWVGLRNHPLAKPLWVNGGLNYFDDQQWTAYTDDSGLVNDQVTAVAVDAAGVKWVGTAAGLSRFDGQSWTSYTSANGLPHHDIRDVAVDAAGRVWVATWGGGAAVLDSAGWVAYATTGLADKQVNAIAIDHAGQPWFATPGGVSHFDGETWTSYTTQDGLVDNYAIALAVGVDGNIWVGSGRGAYDGGGLSRYDGQSWRSYTTADGLAANNISALAVDNSGQLWAVSYAPGQFAPITGLSRFDGQQWQPQDARGIADDPVYSFVIEPTGQLWFGTGSSYDSGGLVHFDGQNWRSYGPAEGLAGSQVYAIALDSAGQKWLGADAGVSVVAGDSWRSYSAADGLITNTVQAIAIEPAPVAAADFKGVWQSVSPEFPFHVTLVQTGTRLAGWHCGTLPDGSRTDCTPDGSARYSITGTIASDVAQLRVVSGYSGAAGQAVLTHAGDSLTWQITAAPAGEFYLPTQAVLKKNSHKKLIEEKH